MMEDKKIKGYLAGIGSTIISVVFLLFSHNIGFDLSGQTMLVFGLVFGILGIGSFWKPLSVGQITAQFLENIQRNYEERGRSSRINTQAMSDSPEGKQVIATDDAKVDMSTHIHNPSPQSEDLDNGEVIIDSLESFLRNVEVYRRSRPLIKQKILSEIAVLAETLKKILHEDVNVDDMIIDLRVSCENVLNSPWGGDAESIEELLEETLEIEEGVGGLIDEL